MSRSPKKKRVRAIVSVDLCDLFPEVIEAKRKFESECKGSRVTMSEAVRRLVGKALAA